MQKEVSHILLNYLASHESLALAGIGRFSRQYRPAYFVGNQLKAPGSILYFEADQTLKNKEEGLSKVFAANQLPETATYAALQNVFDEVNRELSQQQLYNYPSLGTFIRSGARVEFQPDQQQFLDGFGYGLESVLVQSVDVEKPVVVKEIKVPVHAPKKKTSNFWLKVAAAVLLLMVANFAVLYFLEQDRSLVQQADLGSYDTIQALEPAKSSVEVSDERTEEQTPELAETEKGSKMAVESKEVAENITAKSNYLIIVGAFRDVQNAKQYIQDLQKAGYTDAAAAGITTSGLHRVAVAKFAKQEMAEAYLEEVKRKLQADAWLMN